MNSQIDNSVNIENVNWQHFPCAYQLFVYLAHNDLIQLSLTCKKLRLKLISKILSKLELMKGGEVLPYKSDEYFKEKEFAILTDKLKEGYLNRYDAVNNCVVWDFVFRGFAKDFFNLFTNITRLELYSKNTGNNHGNNIMNLKIGSNTILTDILYPLKKLESLIMGSEFINDSRSKSELILKLPNSLKVLHLIECILGSWCLSFYPIENINEEYTYLKKLSIINDTMLNNMLNRFESLTEVILFSHQRYCFKKLSQFLSLNSQLKKLTVPSHFLGCDVIKTILRMNQLKQLNINLSYCCDKYQLDDIPFNTSIEHLNISYHMLNVKLLPILNNLKSLKILEFSNFDFGYFNDFNFSACTSIIPLLHLNNLTYAKSYIDRYINPEAFDKIRFTNLFELNEYLMEYGRDNLKKWEVYKANPMNGSDFWLKKINRQ